MKVHFDFQNGWRDLAAEQSASKSLPKRSCKTRQLWHFKSETAKHFNRGNKMMSLSHMTQENLEFKDHLMNVKN